MRNAIPLALLVLSNAVVVRSEVVRFRNGDQLTGDWVRVFDGRLALKTESVGELAIPLEKIEVFNSTREAVIILRGGRRMRGKLSLGTSGSWYVMTQSGITVIPASVVEAIYPQEIYEPQSPERKGKAWQGWHGTGNLGYSRERGDVQSGSITLGVDATRRQPNLPGFPEHLRTHYQIGMLLANTKPFNGPRFSANSLTSSLRQDFLFTPSNFAFVLGQLDHIDAQSLDLRQTYGAGLGRDVIRSGRTRLDFVGGTTMVKERFETGVRRNSFEALLGEKLSLQLLPYLGINENFNFYPNLSDTGEYRTDSTSTISVRLSSWLSMNTGFTDRFLSRPLPGHASNEFLVTTGLGFRF